MTNDLHPTIDWTLFLRVNSAQACAKVLRRVEQATGLSLIVRKQEQYWKDKHLYRVEAASSLTTEEIQSTVFELLQRCHRLAAHWTVTGPFQNADGAWEFTGGASQRDIGIVGVELANFRLQPAGDDSTAHPSDNTEGGNQPPHSSID